MKSLEPTGSAVRYVGRSIRPGTCGRPGFHGWDGEQLEVTGIVDKEGGLRVCPTGPDDIARKDNA